MYDDGQRMDLDVTIALKLAEISKDASPMVRFEAALALNRFVGKYIAAFVSIAGKGFGGQQSFIIQHIISGSIKKDRFAW